MAKRPSILSDMLPVMVSESVFRLQLAATFPNRTLKYVRSPTLWHGYRGIQKVVEIRPK